MVKLFNSLFILNSEGFMVTSFTRLFSRYYTSGTHASITPPCFHDVQQRIENLDFSERFKFHPSNLLHHDSFAVSAEDPVFLRCAARINVRKHQEYFAMTPKSARVI